MQTNINITRTLVETPDGVLSIHQISKKLKLPYGTTYNRVHALHKLGIIQMLHQGKAKLCAMNADNPMTASLLALGSAQRTDSFIHSDYALGNLFKKIRDTVAKKNSHCLSSAILLTPESLKNAIIYQQNQTINEIEPNQSLAIDFFFIRSNDDFDEEKTETAVSSLLPPGLPINLTRMTVDRDTLLGMLSENENEAGLSAYSMLHQGITLFGFENFYSIVLEAFAHKLAS